MPDPSAECVHHWIIDTAQGHFSKGECQICGETKEFINSFDGSGTWTQSSGVPPGSLKTNRATPNSSNTGDDE